MASDTPFEQRRRWAGALLCAAAGLAVARPARADDGAADPQRQTRLRRASDAVIGLRVQAVDGAPSNRTLGRDRSGSGVVIDDRGLVLTIGYLILEADQIDLITDDARVIPARAVAVDVATGFGLVQALAPLKLAPVPLGPSTVASTGDTVVVVSGGQGGAVGPARVVSRRPYSGWWEYHLEEALFTSPARDDHAGAALFNLDGELLGIGSLVLPQVMGAGGPPTSGNLFVPVDLLTPVLDEMTRTGSSAQSHRAWLGLHCVEFDGGVRVLRVQDDGPAAAAGLAPGDRILAIDGRPVDRLETLWKALWSGGPANRTVTLRTDRGGPPREVTLRAVDRLRTLRRAEGT